MFVSEQLVYTELHKTACSHIGKLLQHCFNGQQVGKHNRIPSRLQSRFVLGSIRNPWDWYVSLWGYGCDARGSVFTQVGRKTHWPYYFKQLPNEMGRKRPAFTYTLRQALHDRHIPTELWLSLYDDVNNVDNFRRWLRLLLAPSRALDIGEGYGFSPLAQQNGLLTYRFLKLFTRLGNKLYAKQLDVSLSGLHAIWQRYGFVDYFVRQEQLADDFIALMQQKQLSLAPLKLQQLDVLLNSRTNTSSRKSLRTYYDNASIALIAQRERFIIDKFAYQAPETLACG